MLLLLWAQPRRVLLFSPCSQEVLLRVLYVRLSVNIHNLNYPGTATSMPPSRPSPYRRVEVRALTWEGHNSQKAQGPVYNADQELRMILDSFNSYGYNVVSRKIPMNPERRDGFHRGFENELANLGRQPGAVLVIVYYQGHGHADRQNRLLLSKYVRQPPSSELESTDILVQWQWPKHALVPHRQRHHQSAVRRPFHS